MTGLSKHHIESHIIDITAISQRAGYHGGLSLNALAGLMAEPYDTVLEALDDMAKRKLANPFGCALTYCPIWYVKGISRDWNAYGGQGYGMSRNERPFVEYTDVYNEAKELAEKYPGKAFTGPGEPTVAELVECRNRLGLPIVLERQSDRECLICKHMMDPRALTVAPDDPFDDDDRVYGDYGEDDPDEEAYLDA